MPSIAILAAAASLVARRLPPRLVSVRRQVHDPPLRGAPEDGDDDRRSGEPEARHELVTVLRPDRPAEQQPGTVKHKERRVQRAQQLGREREL